MRSFSAFIADLNEAVKQTALLKHPTVMRFLAYEKSKKMLPSGVSKDKLLGDVYQELQPLLTNTHEKFKKLLNKMVGGKKRGNTKILTDIKSLKSLKSKVIARKKPLQGIGDLVRGALLFEFKEEADKFVKDFRRKHANLIIKYDEKQKENKNSFGYYGSHHFKLALNGILVELQVMTNKLWSYKEAGHEYYNKYRDAGTDAKVSRSDIAASQGTFFKGNRPKFKRESVEDVFNEFPDLDSLLREMFLPKD